MFMCRAGPWWICSCAELANGGDAHVQWWSIEGYAHVQSWSMVHILMCSGGQWWIFSCVELDNCGYTHVQWWSMLDMLRCSSGL